VAKKLFVMFVVVLLVGIGSTRAVTMDWKNVNNPGNTNDSTGYGGVSNSYRISTYEVTAGQYTEFLSSVAATDSHGLYNANMLSNSQIQQSGRSGSYTYSVTAGWEDRPVNFVDWYDTLRFSNWMHNGQGAGDTENGAYDMSLGTSVVRKAGAQVWLPSEDEWYKAAYHKNDGITGNYFDYPSSSDTSPGRNMAETTNAGNNSNYYVVGPGFLIGNPYFRTEVGEFELSDSPYGAFDMGGNVWEWNEALIGSDRGIRGGSYGDTVSRLGSSYRASYAPDNEGGGVGFRVASIPEPCSVVLLALGGLTLLRRKR